MQVGIIGLPFSGKTTLFRALTGLGEAGAGATTDLAVVKVPDVRVVELANRCGRTLPVRAHYRRRWDARLDRGAGIRGSGLEHQDHRSVRTHTKRQHLGPPLKRTLRTLSSE